MLKITAMCLSVGDTLLFQHLLIFNRDVVLLYLGRENRNLISLFDLPTASRMFFLFHAIVISASLFGAFCFLHLSPTHLYIVLYKFATAVMVQIDSTKH